MDNSIHVNTKWYAA